MKLINGVTAVSIYFWLIFCWWMSCCPIFWYFIFSFIWLSGLWYIYLVFSVSLVLVFLYRLWFICVVLCHTYHFPQHHNSLVYYKSKTKNCSITGPTQQIASTIIENYYLKSLDDLINSIDNHRKILSKFIGWSHK